MVWEEFLQAFQLAGARGGPGCASGDDQQGYPWGLRLRPDQTNRGPDTLRGLLSEDIVGVMTGIRVTAVTSPAHSSENAHFSGTLFPLLTQLLK